MSSPRHIRRRTVSWTQERYRSSTIRRAMTVEDIPCCGRLTDINADYLLIHFQTLTVLQVESIVHSAMFIDSNFSCFKTYKYDLQPQSLLTQHNKEVQKSTCQNLLRYTVNSHFFYRMVTFENGFSEPGPAASQADRSPMKRVCYVSSWIVLEWYSKR